MPRCPPVKICDRLWMPVLQVDGHLGYDPYCVMVVGFRVFIPELAYHATSREAVTRCGTFDGESLLPDEIVVHLNAHHSHDCP